MSQQNKAWIRNSIAVSDLMPLWHLIAMQMRFKEVIPLAVAPALVSTWYSLAKLTKHSLLSCVRCLTLCGHWTCCLRLLSGTGPLRGHFHLGTLPSYLWDTLVCVPRQDWESSFVMCFFCCLNYFLIIAKQVFLDMFYSLNLCGVHTGVS